ncbi:hypothetical protein JR316_0005355 [Psilocybe cubensis]|uniref:Uncharacterized protein n=2 Tax=Psilocybe cubensis TaxID=181762 RepID=A0ACB8H6X2_PSICU|nr:hypothetical protein JR316_0005355 [Psilocybe cubensis]KAH9483251.1 hypothetical protein JR316_0005355 [Psilocybe cubensis]
MVNGILDDTSDEEDPNTFGETILEPGGRHAHIQYSSNVEESASREREPIMPSTLETDSTTVSLEKDLPDALRSVVVKAEPQEVESIESLNQQVSIALPRKRRRMVPEVVVPTWASLQQRDKKNFDKIKKMNNPKIKKTKDMTLNLSSIYDRLKDIGLDPYEVTLESEIRDVSVSRQFLSSVYGGGPQDVFPLIGAAKLAQHGIKNFMYVNVESHSHAPQFVGNPGLFFVTEQPPEIFDDLYYTFVRLSSAEWLYVGIYCLMPSPSLSKEEWKSMTEKVRRKWVSMIFKKNWAGGFRQRISARRNVNNITPEDIRSVLDSGEETLGVHAMKCVGYDERFQRELAMRFSNWVPPPPKPRNERRGEGTGSETKTKTRAKGSRMPTKTGKRKLGEPTDSETPDSDSNTGVVDQFNEDHIDSKDQKDKAPSTKIKSKQRSQRLRGAFSNHSVNVLELSDSESAGDVLLVDNWDENSGSRDDPIVL